MLTKLVVCDKFAGEFNATSNAYKFKCVTDNVHKHSSAHAPTRLTLSPLFSIGSNVPNDDADISLANSAVLQIGYINRKCQKCCVITSKLNCLQS
jgi:hypothetical protein